MTGTKPARAITAKAAALALVLAGCRGEVAEPPRYVEVGRDRGLAIPAWCGSPAKDHLLESVGSGAAFVDLDGDGDDDLFLLNGWRLSDQAADSDRRRVLERGRFAFYRNRGDGTFADETDRAGLSGGGAWGLAVAAGDIEGDGDLDLYVVCFGPNLLYRNRGDGTFEEIAAAAGVADPGWGGGAAFFDAEGDGDLDLYVSNYAEATLDQVLEAKRTLIYKGKLEVMVGPFGFAGAEDRFFRNRGDGSFEPASAASGLVDEGRGFGLGVLAADLDEDGDVDVYVANDSNPNYLFRNEGAGRFSEIGVVSGAAFDAGGAAQAGMGVTTADFDGDGILDLFVTNFAQDASTLYLGEGKLFYHDASQALGIHGPTYEPLSWGTLPIDFDQDGRLDLVCANGHIYPQVDELGGAMGYHQPNQLLLRRGSGFIDSSAGAGPGFAIAGSFRALAQGDLDGDGDPDLLFTRIDQPPLLLRYEGGARRRWITLVPSPHPWPSWIGARIDLDAGGTRQSRVILSGGSFAAQSSLKASFAIGAAAKAERVVVRFPGGARREFRDVPAGATLSVEVPPPPPRR